MKLDSRTVQKIMTFKEGTLSFVDGNGYPFSQDSGFQLHSADRIEMPRPKNPRFLVAPNQKACIIFHYHDEKIAHLRQVLLRGVLNDQEGKLVFTPRHASGFEQDGIMNNLNFVMNGKKATAEYFRRRGMKMPDIKWPDQAFWDKYWKKDA